MEPVNIKIQGHIFSFTPRYAAGHVLTEDEAKVLNQTLGENLRNNFAAAIRKKEEEIKKATPEGQTPRVFTDEELAAFQTEFASYQASYTFRAPRVGPGPVDPVQREANKIAKAMVQAALDARNIAVKSLPEGKLEELIARVIESKPEVLEEARRRVAAVAAAGDDILGDLGTGNGG